MKHMLSYIQQHLSLRLGLLILFVVGTVFSLSLGVLFYRSKQYIQRAAYHQAFETLNETVQHITAIMDKTEKETAEIEQIIQTRLQPDSLLNISRRMVQQHPDIFGFTIAMKPDYFPQAGKRFSAYSLRRADSIQTVVEKHNYFRQVWYKTSWEQKRGCWLEPYIDDQFLALSSNEYNFSYTKPLYDQNGQPIGILCTDLLLKWLSQAVTAVKPYPNSSAIMLGSDGRYIVHPDTNKLVHQSIFSDPDPRSLQEVVTLGRNMLAGHSGMQQLIVDGNDAHVFYRPLERTGWSIAIVCPDSDVFGIYNRMLYTVWTVIALSMLLLMLFCYQIIRRAIVPINELAVSAHRIADGHFDETLPRSNRIDTVGQLQNSFVLMQQSLNSSMTQLQQITDAMEQQNQELHRAYQRAREADQQKTDFIQDMTHQIRTPLNIINGFTQVITTNYQDLPAEEFSDITARMKSSAKAISRISRMLAAFAAEGRQQIAEQNVIRCNELCRDAVAAVAGLAPSTVNIVINSTMPDDFCFLSDRKSLLSILVELLINALRFAPVGTITIGCHVNNEANIVFSVSDMGPGIDPSDRNRIFSQFTKLNAFSEGLGLGLTLCCHTANLLGGSLTLDESYSSGTRFIMALPLVSPPPLS